MHGRAHRRGGRCIGHRRLPAGISAGQSRTYIPWRSVADGTPSSPARHWVCRSRCEPAGILQHRVRVSASTGLVRCTSIPASRVTPCHLPDPNRIAPPATDSAPELGSRPPGDFIAIDIGQADVEQYHIGLEPGNASNASSPRYTVFAVCPDRVSSAHRLSAASALSSTISTRRRRWRRRHRPRSSVAARCGGSWPRAAASEW